jgi:hypothetical protein
MMHDVMIMQKKKKDLIGVFSWAVTADSSLVLISNPLATVKSGYMLRRRGQIGRVIELRFTVRRDKFQCHPLFQHLPFYSCTPAQ